MNGLGASNTEIADAWITYYGRYRAVDEPPAIHDDDPAWWAVDAVMDLELENPLRALEIVFTIARKSTDDWVLENLGAGPLETLLTCDPTFLDAVRVEVASSTNLLEALRSVWTSSMPAEIRDSIQLLVSR